MKHVRNKITPFNRPYSGDIGEGQLALNLVSRDIFTKNGDGSVVEMPGFMKPVDSLVDMLALPAKTGATCFWRDDLRGGTFVYDETKVSENDGGVVFDGWVRQYSGKINALWFGIKNDNLETSASDNTARLQALFDLSSEKGHTLFFPNGFYLFDAPLLIRESLSIEGEGISKSRSTTGDINDRGFVLKYVGAVTADYLVSISDPAPSTSVYMYGTHVMRIRLDCGGSQNAMTVKGINEFFNMEDVEIGNYTGIGLNVTKEDTTNRVSNQATFRRLKLVPSSIVPTQAVGVETQYAHRCAFESVTVDMQSSSSTVPIHRGFKIKRGTRNCTFINCYSENCTVGFDIGEDVPGDNDTVLGNIFINPNIESPDVAPANTSISGINKTIAFLIRGGVKWVNISGLFASTPNQPNLTYDYLLFNEHQNEHIKTSGGSSDRTGLVVCSEDGEGNNVFLSDEKTIFSGVSAMKEFSLSQNSAYPSVNKGTSARTNNSVATMITGFGDGVEGQYLEVRVRDNNTTFDSDNVVNGDSILLGQGGASISPAINSMLIFRKRGTAWIEISRMLR